MRLLAILIHPRLGGKGFSILLINSLERSSLSSSIVVRVITSLGIEYLFNEHDDNLARLRFCDNAIKEHFRGTRSISFQPVYRMEALIFHVTIVKSCLGVLSD